MLHAYTEDQLVEPPAIALFAELGWRNAVGYRENDGQPPNRSYRGRK